MDSKSINGLVMLLVFLAIPCVYSQTTPSIASSPAAATTSTPAPANLSSKTIKAGISGSQVTVTSTAAVHNTHTPASSTNKPKQCIKGHCVASGDDDSCVRKIKGTCPLVGSCTHTVTKNHTHSEFTLDCGQQPCPSKMPATTAPPVAAATTTTTTCCMDNLCHPFHQKSAAVRFSTNVLYLAGFVISVALL